MGLQMGEIFVLGLKRKGVVFLVNKVGRAFRRKSMSSCRDVVTFEVSIVKGLPVVMEY